MGDFGTLWANSIFFKRNIIGTNLLTKFHEDRKLNVASRALTRVYYSHEKKCPVPWQPWFSTNRHHIIGMNLLTEFHEDRTINVASRVHKMKNAPPLGSHVFQANIRTINLASRVKNAPPPGGHVFEETKTIFKLIQDIIGTNLLTKFHEDRKINVASRVLTRKNAPPPGGYIEQSMWPLEKNAPPHGSHVFQAKVAIFKLIQYIIGANLLTKFHGDRKINVVSRAKNAPPLGSHVFQANVSIFKLVQDIIETNLLTKFHEDWKKSGL
ncbi:hypothetical protein DPMN_006353 [Dreissena polymorpha]|uniref:Uncharacterized protein n=1 Tax=Dreissena polymorpha TaxID=45954 RepID=A0A9D4MUE8_DREPO|nr:hypothetical protein DPMN_006353 [Dreissena polymorpha]